MRTIFLLLRSYAMGGWLVGWLVGVSSTLRLHRSAEMANAEHHGELSSSKAHFINGAIPFGEQALMLS
jgi:hypothetical protein